MAKQYWVGEFYVDLSRNQISQLGQSQTLPPKALKVLTQLAQHRGQVVTYDELLDNVWPDSVVTPNTLQRCIAQLRKALGEDSKAQGIIKTHAKQGYSLECDVSWSQNAVAEVTQADEHTQEQQVDETKSLEIHATPLEGAVETQPSNTKNIQKNNPKVFWIGAVALLLLLATVFIQFQPSPAQLKFTDLQYLTATDDKEYGGSYSPDGKFILFHRYREKVCINNIWAKDRDSLEEILLTKEMGTYGSHSFSPDGRSLVFIKQEDCRKPITQNTCYSLMTLDFQQALNSPQSPKEILNCRNSAIKRPVWVDEQNIVLMQKDDIRWRLIRYSVTEESSTDLYRVEDGNILYFSYSAKRNLFAVTVFKSDGQQYIEMLTPLGEVISSHAVSLPQGAPRLFKIFPDFVPNSDLLMFAAGGQLYTLNKFGDISVAQFPFADKVGSPKFAPNGEHVLMGKGRYDSDIAKVSVQSPDQLSIITPLDQPQSQGTFPANMSVIERSIEGEANAVFQPDGDHIAFSSRRTGTDQVWMFDGSKARVLSEFPRGNYIGSIQWAKDGKSLLVLTDRELRQLQLDRELAPIDLPYQVAELFEWNSDTHKVVAKIIVNGAGKLVEIDLLTQEYVLLHNRKVNWTALSESADLIFMDNLNRFWRKTKGGVEEKLIEPLIDQGSSKRFVISNHVLFGINRENQLWSYNLQSAEFNVLANVTQDINFISDVSNNQFLVTFVVAEKKEIVELKVNHSS